MSSCNDGIRYSPGSLQLGFAAFFHSSKQFSVQIENRVTIVAAQDHGILRPEGFEPVLGILRYDSHKRFRFFSDLIIDVLSSSCRLYYQG